jgi:hypothetical protein
MIMKRKTKSKTNLSQYHFVQQDRLFSVHIGYLVIRMIKKHRLQQCNVSIKIKINQKK